ncbi:hypothetical protein DL89DRAFT_81682 [Linderina pennispora]|uniref:Uncharacterized protein n=1 Tax=Linderina pennispora TaxID=61395 RepID=A0A1Y1WGV4_9FUNG|nr:uncharacterized protein DL89DRAFT_81682 [Linderina pennispora]ORX72702.1 hypothetical protein DL89DRAFT_81682 [Linderina pennispora]
MVYSRPVNFFLLFLSQQQHRERGTWVLLMACDREIASVGLFVRHNPASCSLGHCRRKMLPTSVCWLGTIFGLVHSLIGWC